MGIIRIIWGSGMVMLLMITRELAVSSTQAQYKVPLT